MMEWLAAPIDPVRVHQVDFYVSWHARLMVLSWALLTPIGVLAARYFKVLPWQDWPRQLDNQTWWRLHRSTQYSVVVLTALAFTLILLAPPNPSRTDGAVWHHAFGFLVIGLAAIQIVGAQFRGTKGGPTAPAADGSLRGDHYDMTLRRRIFEAVHKTSGYIAAVVSFVAIFLGLWQANGPRWMWIALAAWALGLVVLFLALAWRRSNISTYEAIWGPDVEPPRQR